MSERVWMKYDCGCVLSGAHLDCVTPPGAGERAAPVDPRDDAAVPRGPYDHAWQEALAARLALEGIPVVFSGTQDEPLWALWNVWKDTGPIVCDPRKAWKGDSYEWCVSGPIREQRFDSSVALSLGEVTRLAVEFWQQLP